jgi:hypothetical protein
MATQVTIVNNVLRELREDTVTNVNDTTYAQLIATFVNRAMEWMQEANHKWSVYITEVDDTWPADGSTTTIDVTETNDRSVLMRDVDNDWYPAVYDITTGELAQCIDYPYQDVIKARALNTSGLTKTAPRAFTVKTDADGRGWTMEIPWAVTSGGTARNWRAYWYIPQAKLALDGTDDDTGITLPAAPIELYALFLAQNERGEEMGQPNGLTFSKAVNALASAIEQDPEFRMRFKGSAHDWSNDENL